LIKLQDYLSYDEIQISSLLALSSGSHFINQGQRGNASQAAAKNTLVEHGVFVGASGPRFEKHDLMDSQHILISGTGFIESTVSPRVFFLRVLFS